MVVMMTTLTPDEQELYLERVAIMVIDGGLFTAEAERRALAMFRSPERQGELFR